MSTKKREVIWGGRIGQCINGRLEVECNRCKSLPLEAIRRPRDTPLWKLEASLKCRSCRKGRYAPPVHMIKLTEKQEMPLRSKRAVVRALARFSRLLTRKHARPGVAKLYDAGLLCV